MDKSSSETCNVCYAVMVWKGSQVPHDEVDCRDEKDNQGVGDFRFINILQFYLFIIIIFYNFFPYVFYPRHLPTPTPTTRDPHPRPTTSTHYPRPTTFSYTLFCSVNHLSGPLRKQCLLARVQKVMVCDSWLVDFDPFCLFRVSRFVALWSSCLGQ